MQEDKIRQIAEQVYQQQATSKQFNVVPNSFHTHNGIDSQKIPFIGLSDTPTSYFGNAGKVVTVNSTESGVEFTGGRASVFYWPSAARTGGSTTDYLGYNVTGLTEANTYTPIPASGTLSDFYIRTPDSQGGGGSYVLTLRVNGVSSPLVITIPAGGGGILSDTTHSVSVTSGDNIDIKRVNNDSGTSATILTYTFRLSN